MKVLYTAPFEPEYLEEIEQHIGCLIPGPLEDEGLMESNELLQLVARVNPDVLIVELNQINGEVIRQTPNLKVIAVCRSGTSNIDIPSASEQGILVVNAPGRNAVAVTEWTIALMINIARNFYTGVETIRNREWTNMLDTFNHLEGSEITGCTLGLVGFGAIGRELVKRITHWDMEVLAFDPYVSPVDVSDLPVKMASLEDVLIRADYIVIAAAATRETEKMIDRDCLALLKPTAYFINIARSSIVDNRALLALLREHKIAGAALDVHDQEPLPFDSPWFDLDNVILTPHLGGATKEVIQRHSKMIFQDLSFWKKGEQPRNLVNPDIWGSRRNA